MWLDNTKDKTRLVEQHKIDWNSEGSRGRRRSNATAKEAVLKEAT
jgi:hypothetical protein